MTPNVPSPSSVARSRARAIALRVTNGPHAGLSVECDKTTVLVGRGSHNDLALTEDRAASASHAGLTKTGSEWILEDYGSKNGTFFFSEGRLERIAGPVRIADGQEFVVGDSIVAFTLADAQQNVRSAQQDVAEPEIALRIYRQNDELRFEWQADGPMSVRRSTTFRPSDFDALHRQLEGALHRLYENSRPAEPNRKFDNRLRDFGRYLSRSCLHSRIVEKLGALQGGFLTIVHDRSSAGIPWELAEIEGAPLCVTFSLGRQILHDDVQSAAYRCADATIRRVLIVCNPTNDLPAAHGHAEELLRAIRVAHPCIDVCFLAGHRAGRLAVLSQLGKCDLAYFTGHAEPDGSGFARWLLNDDALAEADISKLERPPAVVIANACGSAEERIPSSHDVVAGMGLPSMFATTGVRHFIGAAWPIVEEDSAVLGAGLVRRILAGDPVGAALRETREQAVERYGWDNPAWAAYSLYGDPATRYEIPVGTNSL